MNVKRRTHLKKMESISISAVKVSAKIPETSIRGIERFCDQNGIRNKRFNRDHLVVYDSSFTFTIFKKSEFSFADQHVNVTRIKNVDDIENAIQDLAWMIDVEPQLIFYTIDTITAVGNIEKKLICKNLSMIIQTCLIISDLTKKYFQVFC